MLSLVLGRKIHQYIFQYIGIHFSKDLLGYLVFFFKESSPCLDFTDATVTLLGVIYRLGKVSIQCIMITQIHSIDWEPNIIALITIKICQPCLGEILDIFSILSLTRILESPVIWWKFLSRWWSIKNTSGSQRVNPPPGSETWTRHQQLFLLLAWFAWKQLQDFTRFNPPTPQPTLLYLPLPQPPPASHTHFIKHAPLLVKKMGMKREYYIHLWDQN